MTSLGWPIRIVDSGGIPIRFSANGFGIPCVESGNGVAVTISDFGIPVISFPPSGYFQLSNKSGSLLLTNKNGTMRLFGKDN